MYEEPPRNAKKEKPITERASVYTMYAPLRTSLSYRLMAGKTIPVPACSVVMGSFRRKEPYRAGSVRMAWARKMPRHETYCSIKAPMEGATMGPQGNQHADVGKNLFLLVASIKILGQRKGHGGTGGRAASLYDACKHQDGDGGGSGTQQRARDIQRYTAHEHGTPAEPVGQRAVQQEKCAEAYEESHQRKIGLGQGDTPDGA